MALKTTKGTMTSGKVNYLGQVLPIQKIYMMKNGTKCLVFDSIKFDTGEIMWESKVDGTVNGIACFDGKLYFGGSKGILWKASPTNGNVLAIVDDSLGLISNVRNTQQGIYTMSYGGKLTFYHNSQHTELLSNATVIGGNGNILMVASDIKDGTDIIETKISMYSGVNEQSSFTLSNDNNASVSVLGTGRYDFYLGSRNNVSFAQGSSQINQLPQASWTRSISRNANKDKLLICGNSVQVTDSKLNKLHEYSNTGTIVSSLIYKNVGYFGGWNNILFSVNIDTGDVIYEKKLPDRISSMTVDENGDIYVACQNSTIYKIKG